MKLHFLTKHKIAAQLLYQKVGYFAQQYYKLTGEDFSSSDAPMPILIVARQHYSEKWQTYSDISLKELKNILKLQKSSSEKSRLIQQYVVNKEQDGFDVKTIEFGQSIINIISRNTILIPETELINSHIDERIVYHLNTPIGEVFWAKSKNRVHSVYRQGLLGSVDSFKMSIGYPSDIDVVSFESYEYLELLKTSLSNINLIRLLNISSIEFDHVFDLNALHRAYWTPIGVAFVFLLLTNGYFLYKNNQVDDQLLSYGDQVSELLSLKVEQDRNSTFIDVINKEVASVDLVHNDWNIVYAAIKFNMHVQRFTKQEDGYVLRGLADDASKVLTVINDLPQVSSAAFLGVVRKSLGKDSFLIQFQLAPVSSEIVKEAS